MSALPECQGDALFARDFVGPAGAEEATTLLYHQLQEMVSHARYADWWTAVSQVQGIYLITDTSDDKQYVGKADDS